MPALRAGDLSICIVSWNVREDLARCLDSLYSDPATGNVQVVVVDNGSTDGTVTMLTERYRQVEVIANEMNRGFAAASNQGMRASGGRYILLLNPDTIVPAGALPELVKAGDRYPAAGIIGPKLLNADGSLQYSCRRFPTIGAALFRSTLLGQLVPNSGSVREYLMADWDHDSVREVDWVSGACMLLRRQMVEQIGYLDEGFFWGSEDVDYCWRAHKAGWKVLYIPSPKIVHLVGRSTDQAVAATILRRHRSMYRLYCKHFATGPLQRAAVWCGVWMRGLLLAASWVVRRAVRRLM